MRRTFKNFRRGVKRPKRSWNSCELTLRDGWSRRSRPRQEWAGLVEQLRQAQRMAEAAKEEGEEQSCKAQEADRQLHGQARENDDLWRQLQEAEETTRTEVDTIRLRLELEGLRQLEEVQKQFDERYTKFKRERDWYISARMQPGLGLDRRPTCSTPRQRAPFKPPR